MCIGHIEPAGVQEFSRTGIQRVSSDAAEDTIAKTFQTEAPLATWTATDCTVQGIQFPTSITLCKISQ